jgi:uncharacterized protein YunC (DUF1805 family)
MAKFSNIKLTQIGINMLAAATATEKITYTTFALGDGTIKDTDKIKDLTDMQNKIISFPVEDIASDNNGQITLTSTVSNKVVEKGFFAKELGIYAKLADGQEKLYAYAYAGDNADYLPDNSEPVDELKLKITLVIGSIDKVTAVIDSSIIFITLEDCRREIKRHNEDVGAHDNIFKSYVKKTGDTMTGDLTGTNFVGALKGNADTATNAANDGTGRNIVDTYPTKTGVGASGKWGIDITGTAVNATNAVTANNANTVAGLAVHSGRNSEVNKIVRTDGSGYIQCGYINSSSGDEKNNSNCSYVWGTNGSDSYMRTYRTGNLCVDYSNHTGRVDNDNTSMRFHWNGQGGQPDWLWGGSNPSDMYVYNPRNFHVSYADSAGNADTVDGWHRDDFKRNMCGRNAPTMTQLLDHTGKTWVGNGNSGIYGQGTGDLALTQDFRNFDKILVLSAGDDCTWQCSTLWETWELEYMFCNTYRINLAKNFSFNWWIWSRVYPGNDKNHKLSTPTNWVLQQEQVVICNIIGINY